jgi:flagellar protein FliO/FliZ
VQVIDRLPIDQRRSIMVLKIGEHFFLVGASEGGINLISKLETEEIAEALAAQQVEKPALGRLATMLSRKPK